MIFSEEGVYELDAHYDRELITIDRSMVPAMTWGVQTPFDKAIYAGNFGETDKPESRGIHDYKWIKFAINEDYDQDDHLFVKYPGDQNYKEERTNLRGMTDTRIILTPACSTCTSCCNA